MPFFSRPLAMPPRWLPNAFAADACASGNKIGIGGFIKMVRQYRGGIHFEQVVLHISSPGVLCAKAIGYRFCLGILASLWMFTTLLVSKILLLTIFHGGWKARSCHLVFHWMIVFGFHGKCFGISNLMFASGLSHTGFFGNLNLLLFLDCKAVRTAATSVVGFNV